MEEVWKDIKGWEPMQVSNLGKVKGLTGRILKTQISSEKNGGYEWLYLFKEGRRKYIGVHRLVAQVFLPNPENLPVVMHLDDNTKNNRVDNLKWGSYKNNTQDSIQKGRFKIVTNTKRGPRGKYNLRK